MKVFKTTTITLFLFVSLFFISCVSKKNLNSNLPQIKIDLNQELQTMDGFGASDAWRCQMVGKNWPLEKRNAIADLLFSQEIDKQGNPKGIGLSIWRFYLGAGSTEQGSNSGITDEWRRSECFQNPDGSYDWNKQEGQRWFLQAAKNRGVEKFLAFTISPPVQMTINGKAFSPQKQNMNIKTRMLPNYADFLVETIDNLQRKEGITFDYLSPINEPQWDWMAGNNGQASQEGTPATNQEIYDFTKLLSDRLNSKSLKTEIVLGEAAIINYLYENVNDENRDDQINAFWGLTGTNISKLSNVKNVITGHSYFSVWPIKDQIAYREKLNSRVKQVQNLKYWQTEYSILEQPGETEIPGGSGHQRDLGMKTALFVARLMHNDIAVANASSWQWWTALTRADFKDGLIYLDDGTNNGSMIDGYCKNDGFFHDSKLLWAFGNYSRFVRPGMIRVKVSNQNEKTESEKIMITAYKDTIKKRIVIVVINTDDSPRTYKLNLSSPLDKKALSPYVTSENSNLKRGEILKNNKVEIPAKSVSTFIGNYK
ncbi:O-glycosyl hydrolase [Flavobacterium cutihirudinis]|uniref:O-glycosyl hydrolase n=1 Tax=Flavobacterium cutihirudinis TaxID=1265740 RepID=A0A3D9FPX0_9FLAO|nr:O-glycosyl hydrolase [Flavobacterium cutihirudinis]